MERKNGIIFHNNHIFEFSKEQEIVAVSHFFHKDRKRQSIGI